MVVVRIRNGSGSREVCGKRQKVVERGRRGKGRGHQALAGTQPGSTRSATGACVCMHVPPHAWEMERREQGGETP